VNFGVGVKEPGKVGKPYSGKAGKRAPAKKNGFEVRVIETRYGLRVLVRQGDSKVWLRERDLAVLFNVLLARVFSETPGEANSNGGQRGKGGD